MKHYTKAELKARAEKNAQAQHEADVVMSNAEANNQTIATLSGKSPKRDSKAPTDIKLAEMLTILENAFVKNSARAREVALANPNVLREVVSTYIDKDNQYHKWASELLAELTVKDVHNIVDAFIAKAKSDIKTAKSAPPAPKSKKAAPKKQSSTKSRDKPNMYALIDSGVCPHDGAKLDKEQPSGKDGAKATCSKCNHEFYINRKIHTRACRTCQSAARKAKTTKGVDVK